MDQLYVVGELHLLQLLIKLKGDEITTVALVGHL